MSTDRLSPELTVTHLASHMARLKQAAQQFQQTAQAVERGYFSPVEDDQVVHLWVSYHMARNALFELINSYQQSNAEKTAGDLEQFAHAFAAVVVLVDAGRFLRELFAEVSIIRRKLNESYKLYGIAAGSFDAIQMSLSDPANVLQIYQANLFFNAHAAEIRRLAASKPPLQAVVDVIDGLANRLDVSIASYVKARANDRTRNAYDKIVHSGAGQAIYAIQTWVSRWIGQLSTLPGHRPALPATIKEELLTRLRPGDVLVTRKEHSLTNYFLPGYWPHAALYIGKEQVIEALADGVRQRSVESPFSVDAIAAIRPQLPAEKINEAIQRAQSHVGKPYDFDFDFTRADRMVCTEVVYRSYEGVGEIQFELTCRAARQNLSAEDLLNLSRQQKHFHHVAVFCPLHAKQLVDQDRAEEVFKATIDT